jgi:uncharacterized phosphosugar-binding protein
MTWIQAAKRVVDDIERTQTEVIEQASQVFANSIRADGLVHLFGTGHSRMAVEEVFPRYGSFPGFHPIVELSMTYHTQVVGANGQRQAMFIERMPGLAEVILDNFVFRPDDSMLVVSASGLNAVPVEMAVGARRRGLTVVALSSVRQSLSQQPRTSHGRLMDNADIVIDLCTPAADALCDVPGLDVPVGPGSTLASAAVVNSIKVRVAEILAAEGGMLPVLTSAAVVGSERSTELFDAAYAEYARRSSRVLKGSSSNGST